MCVRLLSLLFSHSCCPVLCHSLLFASFVHSLSVARARPHSFARSRCYHRRISTCPTPSFIIVLGLSSFIRVRPTFGSDLGNNRTAALREPSPAGRQPQLTLGFCFCSNEQVLRRFTWSNCCKKDRHRSKREDIYKKEEGRKTNRLGYCMSMTSAARSDILTSFFFSLVPNPIHSRDSRHLRIYTKYRRNQADVKSGEGGSNIYTHIHIETRYIGKYNARCVPPIGCQGGAVFHRLFAVFHRFGNAPSM